MLAVLTAVNVTNLRKHAQSSTAVNIMVAEGNAKVLFDRVCYGYTGIP